MKVKKVLCGWQGRGLVTLLLADLSCGPVGHS